MEPIPVLDSIEGFFVGDVVHQNEAHGPTVIGCGDGPVPLLTSCVLCREMEESVSEMPAFPSAKCS